MQYTAIFHGCKKDNFQMKNFDVLLFLLKTLIVHTRLNRLNEAVLTGTHNLRFRAKIRKTMYTQFYHIKVGCRGYTLHGHVIMIVAYF